LLTSEQRTLKELIYLKKTDAPSSIIWENHNGEKAHFTLPVIFLFLYATMI